jgi:Fur family ferric uptake transcriptional regulator/Fur family peroxide stress response transcriptional regulator
MLKSQRITKQKTAILELLRSVESHPTAEWLYQEARKKIPGISLGTVYRNLNQLRDNGEITELNYGSSQSRFDGRQDKHYHFCCVNCGKVYDLPIPLIKVIETKAKAASDFLITGYRLEYYGLCRECQEMERAV